jgi:CheY-like chemotaxis protein
MRRGEKILGNSIDLKSTLDSIPTKVLLAEDEFLIRYDLAEVIRELGWDVVEVGSADDGIALLRDGMQIDLLITDINMPGENDGVDLARMMRQLRPSTPIVMTSGLLRASALPEGLFDVFVPKPAFDWKPILVNLMGHRVQAK